MWQHDGNRASLMQVGRTRAAAFFIIAGGKAVRMWEAVSNCIAGGWWQHGYGWEYGRGWGERRK